MANLIEATQGKTRDLPISQALRALLIKAGEAAGVDTVRVTSGGQCKIGTCTKRTGSTRHDEGQAADLQLIKGGTLDFTDAQDLPIFKTFVSAAARAGATGIGAGIDYMGPKTVHIGFGGRAIWGAGGKEANAPRWLVTAAKAGWNASGDFASMDDENLDSADEEAEADYADLPTGREVDD